MGIKRRDTDAISKSVNMDKVKIISKPWTKEEIEKAKRANKQETISKQKESK